MKDLPKGWSRRRLADVATVILGQSPPGSSYNAEGLGCAFFQGKTEFGDLHPTVRKWTTAGTKFAEPGDVLVSVRAPVGPTNVTLIPCAIGRGLAALRAGADIDSQYLLHVMRGTEQTLASKATGTTFEAISGAVLRDHLIPVPPLDEQRRIVAILEDHLSRLVTAGASLQSVESRLRAFRASRLHASVMGSLDLRDSVDESLTHGAFSDWKWMRLGDLVERGSGFKRGPFGSALTKSTFVESGYQVYEQYAPINDDCHRGRYYITAEHYRRLEAFSVRPGDFLVSCAGTLGKITQVPTDAPPGVINQALLRLRVNREHVDEQYFLWLMRSPYMQQQLISGASGTAMVNLKAVKDLKEIRVPVPPLDRQVVLLEEIRGGFEAAERLEASLEGVIVRQGHLRSSILAAAFSGQLSKESSLV